MLHFRYVRAEQVNTSSSVNDPARPPAPVSNKLHHPSVLSKLETTQTVLLFKGQDSSSKKGHNECKLSWIYSSARWTDRKKRQKGFLL